MARDLRMNIDADASGARRGLDAAGRALDDVAGQARQVERSFIAASGAAVVVAKRIDNVGDQSRQSATDLDKLKRKIVETELAMKSLGAQFAKSGNATALADFKKQGTLLSSLRRVEKLITPAKGPEPKRDEGFFGFFANASQVGAKAGLEAGQGFMGAISGVFKSMPPEAQAGITAGLLTAVAAAAPVIAGAINAALLLGVGGGGLAAGILLAAHDERVKAAFSDFASFAMAGLEAATDPFRDELVATAGIFRQAFAESAPELRTIFSALSDAVQPLARGLAGLIQNALPGIRRAAQAAVPLFAELAKDLPELGDAVGDFFGGVAEGAPGAIAFMREFLAATEDTLRGFGLWLGEYGQVLAGAAAISSAMGLTDNKTHVLTGGLGETADAFGDVSSSADTASRAVHKFKLDLDELFGRQMDAREAAIAYEQAIDDLADGFKRGSDALDITTQKGRDNLRLVNDLINAAREKLKADLAAGDGTQASVDKANAAYQAEIQQIREVLHHLGLTDAQINVLIGDAANIPRNITIDVGLVGANAAAGMLNSLGNAIGRLSGFGGVSASASKSMQKRAAGGPVTAGEPYIVGDGGRPEIFVPNVNGRILPDASAMARHASAGSSGSTRWTAPNLVYSGNPTGLQAMFLSWLMKEVRVGNLRLT